MNEMSLEEQIRCMEAMRSFLGEFCALMNQAMDDFQKDIKFLRSNGLSIETEEQYQQGYYTPAKAQVDNVINDIQVKHFDYIDRVIEYLRSAANEQ